METQRYLLLKKEFYFIRHGQTEYNTPEKNKEDHPSDTPLNEAGRNQAVKVEPLIASLPVKTICCSPLKRAQETKKIITSRLEADHQEIADLTECDAYIWQTMTSLGPNAHLLAQDRVLTFMRRVADGINQALSHPGPVLIVAHGGIHSAACCLMEVEHEWAIDNCIPVHFSLTESGQWRAKKLLHEGSDLFRL